MMEYKVYTSELTSGETWNTFTEEEPLESPRTPVSEKKWYPGQRIWSEELKLR